LTERPKEKIPNARFTRLELLHALREKLFGCNLHAVEPERVYRLARGRVRDEDFLPLLKRLGIRTAVDLRRAGTAGQDPLPPGAFQQEGIRHENVHLRSSALPFPSHLQRFVDILDGADYPLLFFCKRGTDKTGFASMLYLLLIRNESIETARRHLAFLPFGHKKRRHEGPWDFMRLLRENGHPQNLRDWIRDDYPDLFRRERPDEEGA